MNAALIVMTILGCNDSGTDCHYIATAQERWPTVAMCDAVSEDHLPTYANQPYPVLISVCQDPEVAGVPNVGPNTHFYTGQAAECAGLKANPLWTFEANAFRMLLPTSDACPSGTRPVYRVFSGRLDANHRYMVERALRDQMATLGWSIEGDGADFVVMCVPS